MTEATGVDTPTPTGGPASGNTNSTRESTTLLRTETSTPTTNKNKGKNNNSGKPSNSVKNTVSTVPSLTESFEGMTPVIKIILQLLGEKLALQEFLTYIPANTDNGADIVSLFRDGEDPIEILEKKDSQY